MSQELRKEEVHVKFLDNDNNYAKPFGDWVKGNAKGAVGGRN